MPARANSIIVVGGGVIGCSILYFLAKRGLRPILVEAGDIGSGASDAAAGSLLVRTEDQRLHRLAEASFEMFPDLVSELMELGGTDPMYSRTPRLDLALDEEGEGELKGWLDNPTLRSFNPEWVNVDDLRTVEPLLGPGILGGLHIESSAIVSGKQLACAFVSAAKTLGAEVRTRLREVRLLRRGRRVTGVQTGDGEVWEADLVTLAAGVWSRPIAAAVGLDVDVAPAKGQTIRLRLACGEHMRTNVYGPGAILVPRPDGSLIAGYTIESAGFDCTPTVSGVRHILDHTVPLVPALAGAAVERPQAGLRPETSTGLPILGRVPDLEGIALATGHYRVGIALSPITGRMVADHLIDGTPIPAELRPT